MEKDFLNPSGFTAWYAQVVEPTFEGAKISPQTMRPIFNSIIEFKQPHQAIAEAVELESAKTAAIIQEHGDDIMKLLNTLPQTVSEKEVIDQIRAMLVEKGWTAQSYSYRGVCASGHEMNIKLDRPTSRDGKCYCGRSIRLEEV